MPPTLSSPSPKRGDALTAMKQLHLWGPKATPRWTELGFRPSSHLILPFSETAVRTIS